MGIKDFFIKKALQSQLKGLPKQQQEIFMALIEKNPDLFKNMAEDLKKLTKQGKGQMEAMFEVMKKYQSQLQDALSDLQPKA